MSLENANPHAKSVGEKALPGRVNYFIGRDPAKWRTDIPTYARVRCQNIYPGTDLVYYGDHHRMEYDFILAAHANPRSIRFAASGARSMLVTEHGDLSITLGDEKILWRKPTIYQGDGASRRKVQGGYALLGGNRFGFAVGAYNPRRPLIIDPILAYATYLDHNYEYYQVRPAITVDRFGNAYIVGQAVPPGRPAPKFERPHDQSEAFVTKLNAAGTAAVYTSYFGGGQDEATGIQVDAEGNAFVSGVAGSPDFPLTPGSFRDKFTDNFGAFVMKLNPRGDQLIYSTLLTSGNISAIAIDDAGNAYLTGFTSDPSFPVTSTAYQKSYFDAPAFAGQFEAFLSVLDGSGSHLLYSSLIGGAENDFGNNVAVARNGDVFISGTSENFHGQSNFPTTSAAFQRSHHGVCDAFVCKFDITKSGADSLIYSTLYGNPPAQGGLGMTRVMGLAINSAGEAYITGHSETGLAVTSSAYQATGNSLDAYLARFSADGSALRYATYIAGHGFQEGGGLALQSDDIVYVAGQTTAADYPVTPNAYQTKTGGGDDGFLAKFDTSKSGASGLIYSTYFGGAGDDLFYSIAIDRNSDVYVAGITNGVIAATPGAFHTSHQFDPKNTWDAMVVKLNFGKTHFSDNLAKPPAKKNAPMRTGKRFMKSKSRTTVKPRKRRH